MGDALHQMQELATFFESAFDTDSGHTLAEEFEPVLGAVVDPLVQMCERSAEALNQKAASRCVPHPKFVRACCLTHADKKRCCRH